MRNKIISKINLVIVLTFLCLICIITLYPLVYAVSAAFSKGNSIASLNLIPFKDGINLVHFKYLFQSTDYLKWFKNTLFVAGATSAATVMICTLGAYIFSRFRFAIKKSLMMSMLILQIFPSTIGMIAVYVILHRINALDTLWGLMCVYVAGNIPYNIWLVKSYMDTIPKSLDEAARIDGASHLKVYWDIVMPVTKPIIIFLAITSFTAPWMDFIFPTMVLRSSSKQTLAIGLFNFVTDKKNEFTNFAAGGLIIAVPFIIFFILTQKTMITSLGASAVKE